MQNRGAISCSDLLPTPTPYSYFRSVFLYDKRTSECLQVADYTVGSEDHENKQRVVLDQSRVVQGFFQKECQD